MHVLVNAGPLLAEGKEIKGYVVAFTDITVRQEAEAEKQKLLEELQKSEMDLQALNEELQVLNEELQSQTEELQVQTEELRVANQEILTTNKALQESEERLRQAAQVGRMFAFEWHSATDAARRSGEAGPILGLSGDVARHDTGQGFFTKILAEDRDRFVRMLHNLNPENDHYTANYRVVRPDNGQVIWLEETGRALFDEEEELQYVYGMSVDITERKQAEEALERQHAILAGINRIFEEALTCKTQEQLWKTCLAVLERLTDKFGFIDELDNNGNLNCIAISYLGWEACKIPGIEEPVLPKNLHIQGIYASCLRQGRPEIINDPGTHPDSVGTPPGHPPLTSFLGVPLKHAGATIGMFGLGNKEGGYTDLDRQTVETLAPAITEAILRKRAEAALRKSEERLQLAQQACRSGTFDWDLQKTIMMTDNLQAIYGFQSGKLETHTRVGLHASCPKTGKKPRPLSSEPWKPGSMRRNSAFAARTRGRSVGWRGADRSFSIKMAIPPACSASTWILPSASRLKRPCGNRKSATAAW